eukprot:g80231.t1
MRPLLSSVTLFALLLNAFSAPIIDGLSPLTQARSLSAPAPEKSVGGEFEGADFWSAHGDVLRAAWKELGLQNSSLGTFEERFLDPELAQAMRKVLAEPNEENEQAVRGLWTELVPGVWQGRVLRDDVISSFRQEVDRCAQAKVPLRRPNGMNRYGMILSGEVDGAVSSLHSFLQRFVLHYLQPLTQTLFPANVGPQDVEDYFAFTVRYRPDEDVALAEHRDASVATLNLNLNQAQAQSDYQYQGSSLYFVDQQDRHTRHNVSFTPGMALLHLGALRHAALPLLSGQRDNLIVWLFGRDGDVRIAPYEPWEQLSMRERWQSTYPRLRPRANTEL